MTNANQTASTERTDVGVIIPFDLNLTVKMSMNVVGPSTAVVLTLTPEQIEGVLQDLVNEILPQVVESGLKEVNKGSSWAELSHDPETFDLNVRPGL